MSREHNGTTRLAEAATHDSVGNNGNRVADVPLPLPFGDPLEDEDKAEWMRTVEFTWNTHKESIWDMADLVNEGLDLFSMNKDERFSLLDEISEQLELARKTIENYCRVAELWPKDMRRWSSLTIHHYGTVNGLILDDDYSVAEAWLTKAAEQGWSVEKLRHEMKVKADPDEEDEDTPPVPTVIRSWFDAHGLRLEQDDEYNHLIRHPDGGLGIVVSSKSKLKWEVVDE